MDIAQVSHTYRPAIGGIENYVFNLNNKLEILGHNTMTYTTDQGLDENTPLSKPENAIYAPTDFQISFQPISLELYRTLKSTNHDLYHFHNPFFATTWAGILAINSDTPSVVTCHGVNVYEPNKTPNGSILSRDLTTNPAAVSMLRAGLKPFVSYVFNEVDQIIVLGQRQRDDLQRWFNIPDHKFEIISNALDIADYQYNTNYTNSVADRYNISSDTPTLLYVSRFSPHKNQKLLIRTLNNYLTETDVDVILVGSGDSDYINQLKSEADDRVQFVTDADFDTVKALYYISDIFTFLGTWEGLPTVILEAMYSENPIISTPVAAIPDVITDYENGILLDWPPTASKLAEAITYYIENQDERSTVGNRNRATIISEYTWDQCAGKIMQVYSELTGPSVPEEKNGSNSKDASSDA